MTKMRRATEAEKARYWEQKAAKKQARELRQENPLVTLAKAFAAYYEQRIARNKAKAKPEATTDAESIPQCPSCWEVPEGE